MKNFVVISKMRNSWPLVFSTLEKLKNNWCLSCLVVIIISVLIFAYTKSNLKLNEEQVSGLTYKGLNNLTLPNDNPLFAQALQDPANLGYFKKQGGLNWKFRVQIEAIRPSTEVIFFSPVQNGEYECEIRNNELWVQGEFFYKILPPASFFDEEGRPRYTQAVMEEQCRATRFASLIITLPKEIGVESPKETG